MLKKGLIRNFGIPFNFLKATQTLFTPVSRPEVCLLSSYEAGDSPIPLMVRIYQRIMLLGVSNFSYTISFSIALWIDKLDPKVLAKSCEIAHAVHVFAICYLG